MTQPPDERDPLVPGPGPTAGEPPADEAGAASDAPTETWTPEPPPSEPSEASQPGQPEPAPASTVGWGALPPTVSPTPPTPPAAVGQPAASPLISAEPAASTPPAAGWPPPPTQPGPIVGWQTPGPAQAAPAADGYVIAGAGARVVAYLIDALLCTIVPSIIWLLVFDFQSMFREVFDEIARQSAAAGAGAATTATVTIPVTTDYILLTLIGLGIQYVYFVGFWTSRGRATPGMRGLKMQLVDVGTGKGLAIGQATKRWIALGFPISLLNLIEPMQSAAGLLQLAVTVFLFFTVIVNDRKQGLHDKFANSLVIRSTTSGDGATVVGCLILGALAIGFAIIATSLVLTAMGPELERLLIDIGNSV